MRRLVLSILAAIVTAACSNGTESWLTPDLVSTAFRSESPAPPGRAVTLEDYYSIRRVGSPELSPAGDRVAYTVSIPVEEDNSSRTETWLVTSDGSGEPVRITHEGADVASPGWTEEGLLRYRAQGSTWTLDVGDPNSRPRRLEETPGGVVSPDGGRVARLDDVPFPEEVAPSLSDFESRHVGRFEGVQFDWMYFQRDGSRFPLPDPRKSPARVIVVSSAEEATASGESLRLIEDLDLRPSGLTWHPDGERLAFIADAHFRDEQSYGRPDLWMAGLDGRVERLTDDGYTYSSLAFSPDGSVLSYVRGFGTDMVIGERLDHGGPSDLFVRPVDGGVPINLTAEWDLEPRGLRWSPDGSHIYFTAGVGGAVHIFRVAIDGGAVEQVTTGERRLGGISFDRGMTRMAYTVGRFEAG